MTDIWDSALYKRYFEERVSINKDLEYAKKMAAGRIYSLYELKDIEDIDIGEVYKIEKDKFSIHSYFECDACGPGVVNCDELSIDKDDGGIEYEYKKGEKKWLVRGGIMGKVKEGSIVAKIVYNPTDSRDWRVVLLHLTDSVSELDNELEKYKLSTS
jgi:vacuolar-type H+-ATPase catalytic subunit A/Vma1